MNLPDQRRLSLAEPPLVWQIHPLQPGPGSAYEPVWFARSHPSAFCAAYDTPELNLLFCSHALFSPAVRPLQMPQENCPMALVLKPNQTAVAGRGTAPLSRSIVHSPGASQAEA